MRICPTCGRSNPDDADFCECGEYLRWEPTNVVRAVAPAAAGRAAVTDRGETVDVAASPEVRRWSPTRDVTLAPAAVPIAAAGGAALTLRLPDGEGASGEAVAVEVEPGARTTILGLIRNQSDVVDNFDLSVRGLPDGMVDGDPGHGVPRPVRDERDLRAGDRDSPASAACARGAGARVVVRGRRDLAHARRARPRARRRASRSAPTSRSPPNFTPSAGPGGSRRATR